MNLTPATQHESVTLRPLRPADEPFLVAVYVSTRLEELAVVGWSEQQKHSFLETQFHAQRRYYESEYPGAEFQVILAGGEPVGRLYLHRRDAEIRIMELALLPGYRRRGIGTQLLREILAEGERSGSRVTIHVEAFNPALQLYKRLGFRRVADNGVYHLLHWLPAGVPAVPTGAINLNQ